MLGLALGRQTEKAWSRPVGSGDSLCDGRDGRIGFAIEPIAVVEYFDLVGPAIPLADEMGAGRNGPCGSGGAVAWCPVHHGGQSAPGCSRMPAMGPALAFVQENAAHEDTRERAWRSNPEGVLSKNSPAPRFLWTVI